MARYAWLRMCNGFLMFTQILSQTARIPLYRTRGILGIQMTVVILIQTRRYQGMNGKMTMSLREVLRTFRIFPKRRVVSTPWPTTLQNSMVLL